VKISTRESVLALVTVAVALFVVTGLLARSKIDDLKLLRRQQEQVRSSVERSKLLVAEQEKWSARMTELQGLMPRFPQAKRMDVYWTTEMERIANSHDLKLIRHEPGAERQEGPIYELPIECRDFAGTLDALVHFLFDLQSEGAMLDIRYLRIKPKDKVLRTGRFSLYCAYRRDP